MILLILSSINIEENDIVVSIRNTHSPRYFKCWFFTSRDKKPFQISAPLFEVKMYLADCFGRPVIWTEMEFQRVYVRWEHIQYSSWNHTRMPYHFFHWGDYLPSSIKVLLWCPIKVRVFHQNESCLSCPHPPLSYEGRRGSSHFDEKLSFW